MADEALSALSGAGAGILAYLASLGFWGAGAVVFGGLFAIALFIQSLGFWLRVFLFIFALFFTLKYFGVI